MLEICQKTETFHHLQTFPNKFDSNIKAVINQKFGRFYVSFYGLIGYVFNGAFTTVHYHQIDF